MTTLRSENFRKSAWFVTITIALYMRFYYHKQPLLHSILLYYYYTLILSYISVISLFVSFVFELGYIFPQSHSMCRISFNSYLNFCIQKSGMSATKFPQSLIVSERIPCHYRDFSCWVWLDGFSWWVCQHQLSVPTLWLDRFSCCAFRQCLSVRALKDCSFVWPVSNRLFICHTNVSTSVILIGTRFYRGALCRSYHKGQVVPQNNSP